MSELLSIERTIRQVAEVLSEPYGEQAEQFIFDLIVLLVQKKDIQAAMAAISARPIPQPTQRCLEMVFATAEDLKRVRGQADLLAAMAQRESISLLLRLESGQGRTPISPNQARSNLRKNTMSAPVIALPGIQVAKMRFSPHLVRTLMEFMEHPDRACGVVELSTQRQLMITESSARMILQEDYTRLMELGREDLVRERVAAATSLRREDYFFAPDLDAFMRMTRELEPNNPDSRREITWRGQSRSGSWVNYTHQYKLIQDDLGKVYHVGQNVAFEPIAEPVAA
jgi:hypothetical protein